MSDQDERQKKQERGFTIVDRRGQREDEAAEHPTPGSEAAEDEAPGGAPLPRIDFAGLLLSFGTSALYHLGEVVDPETGKPGPVDLPVARQSIDALEVLEEKTRGNLSEDEQTLLGHLLTDLRMRFVQKSK